VAQSVRVDMLVGKAGSLGGVLAGRPEYLGCDRMTPRMPSVARKQPVGWLAPETAPIRAQFLEQLRAEHDVAVLAALAFADMNDHPLTVDIADLQMRCFCATCACGIERHEQNAVKWLLSRVNQSGDLFLAQYLRKVKHLLRIGRLSDAPVPLQDLDVKEAQRGQAQANSVGAELKLGEQSCLILADMLGAELIGLAIEVSTEVFDTMQVRTDGCIGEVAAPQLLKHELT